MDPLLAWKMRALEERRAEYDAVFVGSSLVYRGVSTAVFDGKLDELGWRVSSFNFGIPRMWMGEAAATVEWILERRDDRLKWIIVELRDLRESSGEGGISRRQARWHSARATWLSCRRAWHANEPLIERIGAIADHLNHFATRLSNCGVAQPYLQSLGPPTVEPAHASMVGPYRDGFVPYDIAMADKETRERGIEFKADPSVFHERVARLLKGKTDRWLNRYDKEFLEHLMETGRSQGVEIIFVAMPRTDARFRFRNDQGEYVLLDFGDPQANPGLFDVRRFFDRGHLNAMGARNFSRRLAKAFHGALALDETR